MLCSCAAQSAPASTSTTLQAAKVGDTSPITRFTAAVTASGNPVLAGQVVFSVNGSDHAPIQLIGGGSTGSGTASLALPLLSGTYKVSARYTGTVAWATSSSAALTVDVSGFVGANLALMNSGSTYQFMLSTREFLAATQGSVSLRDIAVSDPLASDPILTSSVTQIKTQSSLQLPFVPSALALGDLLGDGQQSLVVADSTHSAINIFSMSATDGSVPTATISVGSQPSAILVQDLDGDGFADIAVVNTGDNTVSLVFQDSAHPGFFKPAESINVGAMPVALVAGDFNHDGFPDLAVANFSDNTVSILLNQNKNVGKFVVASTIGTPGGPSSLAVGSFFGTTSVDLAVSAFYDNSVSILANQPGQAALLLPGKQVFRVGTGPTSVVVGDFNGDGLADLAVCNSVDGTVSVLSALPASPGQFPVQDVYDGFVQPSTSAALVSLDGVAPTDLAVTDSVTGQLTLLHNDGSGRLTNREIKVLGGSLTSVSSVHRFVSGAYMLATLDPSLRAVHYDSLEWGMKGSFSAIPPTSSTPVLLQALYVPSHVTSPTVLSNTITVSALPRLPQTITFAQIGSVIYGSGPVALTASSTANLPVTFSIINGAASIVGTQIVSPLPGDIVIQADQAGDNTFSAATPVQRTVSVALAPLSIVPQAVSRALGTNNPIFTGSVSGLIGSDTVQVDYASSADSATPAGSYSSAPLGISAHPRLTSVLNRYQITSTIGTLTICSLQPTADRTSQCAEVASDPVSSPPTPVSSAPVVAPAPVSPPTPVGKGLPITPIQTGGTTTIVGTGGPGSNQVGNTNGGPSTVVLGGLSTPPSNGPSPVTGPGSPGIGKPSDPKLPHGLYPHGGPINAPPVRSSNNDGGGRLPGPTTPVRLPSSGTGGSPSAPIVLPTPIIIPSLPHPMLPLIGITFGKSDHSKPLPSSPDLSAILLLQDGRVSEIPGLMAITMTLNCSADHGQSKTIVLSVNDSAIATLRVKNGEEFKTYLPLSRFGGGQLVAHFAGSDSCPIAKSEAVVIQTPTTDFLELVRTPVSGELDRPGPNDSAEGKDDEQNPVNQD